MKEEKRKTGYLFRRRIQFDLRNLSEILYSLDCRCTRRKRENIWNRFKFDGGHRIGVDIDTKR